MANTTTYRPGGKMSTKAFVVTITDTMDQAAVLEQLETMADALDALASRVDGYTAQQGVLQAAADLWDVSAELGARASRGRE